MGKAGRARHVFDILSKERLSNPSIGEIRVTMKGIRHSLQEMPRPWKDELMVTPGRLAAVISRAKAKEAPVTKPHVAKTWRISSRVTLRGIRYRFGAVIHKNLETGASVLYHVSMRRQQKK
jgi:hypothetical protein